LSYLNMYMGLGHDHKIDLRNNTNLTDLWLRIEGYKHPIDSRNTKLK